ncbi:MAG: DUF4837 family protein [Bacteroidetes bacterium]|nr:MAG: DUF4837 family protein [Bacteroidota bacterium]
MGTISTGRPLSGILCTVFLGLTASGCFDGAYLPNATGSEVEIAVVTDSASWHGIIGETLRTELSPWISTLPAPEKMFRLVHTPLTDAKSLKRVKTLKNVVFVAPISDSTLEAQFLRAILDEEGEAGILGGVSTVVPRRDLWRRNQQVFYVLGGTEEAVVNIVKKAGDNLRYTFNSIIRERVTIEMFRRGRQFDIEEKLMEKHGFAVNAQHDYFTAIDTTNFVWLRRVINSDSWRSIFIWWIDDASPNSLTPEWIYEARQRLTESWIAGNSGGFVSIDFRRDLETENIDFLGRFGYETRGLWHMVGRDDDGKTVEYGMGGPFVTYSFYDEATRRIYMIDGMVFAPGFDKREFLRHVEAIAHTFRLQEVDDSGDSSESTPPHNSDLGH